MEITPTFIAGHPLGTGPVDALAIYCSDGRFTRQCEQFIQQKLSVLRCDRLIVPGGPAALIEPDAKHCAFASASFLITAHKVPRVLLIMHDDCGYYAHRREVTGSAQRESQHADLPKVAARLREIDDALRIDAYVAHIGGDEQQVLFLEVEV